MTNATRWVILFKTYSSSPWVSKYKLFMSRDAAVQEANRMLEAGTYSVIVHWLDMAEPKRKGQLS